MSEASANPACVKQYTSATLRNRPLAGALSLIYCALFALAGYLESIRIEDYWPTWALIVGGVTGFAIMMVLPFLVVKYFFGLDLSPLWQFALRFSLRRMLVAVFWISLFVWYYTQMDWLKQRQAWRRDNRAIASAMQGRAPFGLLRFLDQGVSRIEIKHGTEKQIAEAKRLFPEATVVVAGEAADDEANSP